MLLLVCRGKNEQAFGVPDEKEMLFLKRPRRFGKDGSATTTTACLPGNEWC